MRKVKILLITLVMLLIQTVITPIYVQALTSVNIALNEGKTVGQSRGQINGQKDSVNGQRNNWKKAYIEEEKRVIDDYNLNQETVIYRFYFLKGFKEMFQPSYENGYREYNISITKTIYEIGQNHGRLFGTISGEVYGGKDYYEGRVNNWKSQIKSDVFLIREYSLNNDVDKYADGFLLGYKLAFEQSYNNAYRQANIDTNKVPKENGILHGWGIGFEFGSFLGKVDFLDKKINNWESALPSDLDIIIKYNLIREVQEYRDGFLVGFKYGFRDGYIESFQDENINLGKDNINYKSIAMLGGELVSADGIMKLIIDPGTIYEEKYISVQKHDFPSVHNVKLYIPVTNSYTVSIESQPKIIDLHNSIMLTFKYYSSERGGIYQLIDNKWRYLYSNIKDKKISTKIDSKSFDGGTYAVFIDNNYKELKDAHNNWAGQEIYTFIRRNYIIGYNDNTFKPNANITRAEFITLLSKVMGWDINISHEQIKNFIDYNTFGVYGDVIAYARSIGLINGYPDNTFKPSNKITYKEVEWIMERLPNNNRFKWSEIEDKMMYEKYTRSESFFSIKNNITRAETVYMLYHLQNEGII